MKRLLIIELFLSLFFLFVANTGVAQNQISSNNLLTRNGLRDTLFSLTKNATEAPELAKWMEQQGQLSPIQLAYYGTFKALAAKIVEGPFEKLSWLKDGKIALDKAVLDSKYDAEVVFLRFCVESQLPRFLLGFYEHEDQDRNRLLSMIPNLSPEQVDPEMVNYILGFMEKYGRCNERQLAQIDDLLNG
jgi:hypothetical protein